MCVIFFYANSQPDSVDGYKLILASNRDEFFARDTQQVAKWTDSQQVYGGIDLEPGREGGTWLAIGSDKGVFKVGALLNLTGEPKPRNAVGRGMIVADFVRQSDEQHNIANYNQQLLADCTKYSAFNFVSIEIGDSSKPAEINLLSNVPPTLAPFKQGQCYGFGNSLPDAPFEKVQYGQQHFDQIVQQHGHSSVETLSAELLQLLKNKHKFWPDVELKRRAPSWGEGLSALNVHIPEHGYGSRTHSLILVDANNKLHFIEETMAGLEPDGEWRRTHIEKQF
ncbi:transport and Golgi organization protein 2 isoform X2 [Drosophila nasuta]|uniref:Transport and Golgi organization protein 2 isoform X2 n=1 Tax=Drosophila albomicans TaxID=7291 RepID=A0A6P8Y4R6_DROAB|nr:transport and Golgi organization protein 2 isoform X2 [Drosophila albomicans]XP_060661915.1 transport and Golgi organization protein 2 isoform X2 [Drosophila nasuta]